MVVPTELHRRDHRPRPGLEPLPRAHLRPAAATWTSADPWRGLPTQPQSLHRYAYVWDNPTSNLDTDGNQCARVTPQNDALPLGCGATPVQAQQNVTDRSKPPVAPQYPNPSAPKATGPNSQNNVTDEHGCRTGTQWYTNSYTNGQCVDKTYLDQQAEAWGKVAAYIGDTGSLFGSDFYSPTTGENLAALFSDFGWGASPAIVLYGGYQFIKFAGIAILITGWAIISGPAQG